MKKSNSYNFIFGQFLKLKNLHGQIHRDFYCVIVSPFFSRNLFLNSNYVSSEWPWSLGKFKRSASPPPPPCFMCTLECALGRDSCYEDNNPGSKTLNSGWKMGDMWKLLPKCIKLGISRPRPRFNFSGSRIKILAWEKQAWIVRLLELDSVGCPVNWRIPISRVGSGSLRYTMELMTYALTSALVKIADWTLVSWWTTCPSLLLAPPASTPCRTTQATVTIQV